MGKIAILYFSGTENTLLVQDLFVRQLTNLGHEVTSRKVEDILNGVTSFQPGEYEMMGIGYPIHAFNAPRIIFDFIKTLPLGHNLRTFLFRTSGGYSPINNGSCISVRDRLITKGYYVFHESLILMGSNFMMKTPDEEVKKLYVVAAEKVARYAEEIHAQTKRLTKVTDGNRLLLGISHFEQFGARMMAKFHYYTTPDCILCQKCVACCPVNNISIENMKVHFGFHCLLCMRCLYTCPMKAIRARGLNFIIIKSGYDIRAIIDNPEINGEYERTEQDSFYQKYKAYIEAE